MAQTDLQPHSRSNTPGMLALLEEHLPGTRVTLWPNPLTREVENLLKTRFPRLEIASTEDAQIEALAQCDFFLHGSATELAGHHAVAMARDAGKPYGFAGVTLKDEEIVEHADLLSGARFIFCRDTNSLVALKRSGITGPTMEFGPDSTFALDLRDEPAADTFLKQHGLREGNYLCVIPRLRTTPYWEVFPESIPINHERERLNQEYADVDHAKFRTAITAWVRQTGMRVCLVPEMTYQVSRLRSLLYDQLPEDVKPHVATSDRFWLPAEAASVYARAAAVLSLELHSPIMAIAAGTPAVHAKQPTDTRKGQMWRDIGLASWLFEIEETNGDEIAERIVKIGTNQKAARKVVGEARSYVRSRMKTMMAATDLQFG
ncbi:MAG: polysaccharide pyruvyl transferase family protein [Phycisphaerae bacterium]|nr:polysaccharide pyruvyl transferase family protein [Phycisphaerae bacterium]